MKRFKQLIVTVALIFGVGAIAIPVPVGAIDVFPTCASGPAASGAVCGSKGEEAVVF